MILSQIVAKKMETKISSIKFDTSFLHLFQIVRKPNIFQRAKKEMK